ncbi:hypothetical protein MUN82_02475 [Hymenobacter aerilatus]|uniref:DUF2946 domain-containing protein n=1 Tax=Hymenobacter aerilatus TaxID=2932251 RepID=A0A8T9SV64_9BACT|nr:DUF6660 family protein [Hymenobacter aerilatus]UOR05978.1 hypothetical protein MUN82_02475 [Hymenobacter aerilatus]
MKLWAFFLAMYVLVLAGLPCADVCQDEPTTTAQAAPDDHKHTESCSPFCLCTACPGFTMPPLVPPVAVASLPSAKQIVVRSLYQAPHALEVPGRIWQPPRLA